MYIVAQPVSPNALLIDEDNNKDECNLLGRKALRAIPRQGHLGTSKDGIVAPLRPLIATKSQRDDKRFEQKTLSTKVVHKKAPLIFAVKS